MARGGRASGSGGGSATVHFAHPNVDTSLKLQGLSVRELCALLEQGQGDVREVQLVEAYGLLVNATRVQVVGGAQASRLLLRDDDPQYRRFECTVTFFGNLPDEISRGSEWPFSSAHENWPLTATHVSHGKGHWQRQPQGRLLGIQRG